MTALQWFAFVILPAAIVAGAYVAMRINERTAHRRNPGE